MVTPRSMQFGVEDSRVAWEQFYAEVRLEQNLLGDGSEPELTQDPPEHKPELVFPQNPPAHVSIPGPSQDSQGHGLAPVVPDSLIEDGSKSVVSENLLGDAWNQDRHRTHQGMCRDQDHHRTHRGIGRVHPKYLSPVKKIQSVIHCQKIKQIMAQG
ncbi:hypothetical protein BASA61_008237 [Batrachochytrium salamandrivorans]|nr:hypothetical protein BASA61_008237 [Batrachochytrium salamandrivorans]